MRYINVAIDDVDWDNLIEAKGDLSWHDFIMTLVPKQEEHPK